MAMNELPFNIAETRVLLRAPEGNREFANYLEAAAFLTTAQWSPVEVWYHGGDGWHYFRGLVCRTNQPEPPLGYLWI